MSDEHTGYEHQIQHAIGQYLKASDEMSIAPMVGNFIVLAEVVDETGIVQLASIKADSLPLWTQIGMLTLQLESMTSSYAAFMLNYITKSEEEEI